MKTRFLSIAATELDDAYSYYESVHVGLGRTFIEEFESTLVRLKRNPEAWQRLSKFTRRCLMNKFPHSVIYQIRVDEILIVAVANNHRKPNYWAERYEN
ncbi:type II toxin-antitoxin system RelE/ParE family toxin [Agaribacter flavus]|uniref:Type II toxin-antitoxin system RelE/ParE family toxin n=1 Tax=Agaribacter flavus TaxID=1902781 RepID=A0ABV7FIS2_9ALTE